VSAVDADDRRAAAAIKLNRCVLILDMREPAVLVDKACIVRWRDAEQLTQSDYRHQFT
jgi:hypothetical protein